jgi:hypothetical protein
MAHGMNNRNREIPSFPKRNQRCTRNAEKMREYIETLPVDFPLLGNGDVTWNWTRFPRVRLELDSPTAITLYLPNEGQIGLLVVDVAVAAPVLFASWEGYPIVYNSFPAGAFTTKTIVTILFEDGEFHVNAGEYT